MQRIKGLSHSGNCLLAAAYASTALWTAAALGDDPADKSRFSDQPAPLRLSDFPDRPPPLLELGDKFLGNGNLQKGYTLPTGAVWSPDLWVFGTLRSAVQTFDSGNSPRVSEWANRLDLYGNLQLSATERVLVGFRPVDQQGVNYTGYTFQPHNMRGWNEAFSATPTTLFFEGEFGEIFPKWDKSDSRSLDYGFAVGRQPLTLQDGILVNDNSVDMISVTRNALRVPFGSTLRVSSFFAWSQIERADNVKDEGAHMYGLDMSADFPVSTVDADLVYVTSTHGGDGFYAGTGFNQRIWKINSVFRVNTSVATESVSARVSNGTLLTSELSFTPPYGDDLVYVNGFWGIDHYASADRDPTAGGPLGRIGILNAAVGIGRYGAPLSDQADNAAGGAIGYQMFFGELRRRQLILELGGRAPTRAPTLFRQEAVEGVAARFQQAFGRRVIWILDAYGAHRDSSSFSFGGRTEILVKF